MGLNTYPSNPFPPSTDRMDADALEAEVNQLKSGLTNVDVALSVPENSGKNVLPLTLDILKAINTSGTWADNVYTHNDVTFTVNVDSDGHVTGVTANGTASADATFYYEKGATNSYNGYKLNGCTGGNSSTYYLALSRNASPWTTNTNYSGDTNITITNGVGIETYTRIKSGYEASDVTFYPMIRPATIADSTFAPYIPSVDARLEAVESGLIDAQSDLTNLGNLSLVYVMASSMSDGQHYYIDLSRFTISGDRCPVIVMSGSQVQVGSAKMTLGMQNNGNFSFPADSGITWDSTNKKIEVDEGGSAWTIPYLIIPKKIIS